MECAQAVGVCLSGINLHTTALLFPHIEDSRLEEICGNYGHTKNCIDEALDSCDPQQKVELANRGETLAYLCTTGYEDYRLVRPCYEEKALLSEVEKCNVTFTSNMAKMTSMSGDVQTKTEYLCGHLTDLVKCVRDSTHDVCGARAANWIYNAKNIMLENTFAQIGCPKKDQLSTILAVSFAVFVAFVIILLAFIFIYRKIKNEEEATKFNKDKSLCKTSIKSTSVRHIKSSEDVGGGGGSGSRAEKSQPETLQQQQRGAKSKGDGKHVTPAGKSENGHLLETSEEGLCDSRESAGVTSALLEDCEHTGEEIV